MNDNLDRLYKLLPSIYRQRDAETGWQLQALLRVIAEQVNIVESDIAQLYDNWFIETCQDWVVPYIGDLIGYQQVHEAGDPGEAIPSGEQQRNKILISRREVANTIHYRRRRGTLALFEQLARDVAAWPALAVEFYKRVGITQNANYPHLERGRSIDIRDGNALYYLGSPFGKEAHTVDVRSIASHRTTGLYNVPNVGLFVWRLKAYPVTQTPAYCKEDVGPHCYTFSILGNDVPLYTKPHSEGISDELAFPNPIGLRAFERRLTDYYGEGKSVQIWTIEDSGGPHEHHEAHHHEQHGQHRGQAHAQQSPKHVSKSRKPESSPPTPEKPQLQLVTPDRIIAADLSEWRYHPLPRKVAVDPVAGRIVFPPGHEPQEVVVSYYYGFSADIGGGEYNRPISQPGVFQLYRVSKSDPVISSIKKALDTWDAWKKRNARQKQPDPSNAVIEIDDNGVYTEQLNIELEENESLQIRAANRKRPVLRMVDWEENRPDSLKVTGEFGSRLTLDGLLIAGRGMQVDGDISEVAIRHSTLVPGWGLHSNCEPHHPAEPSLLLYQRGEQVTIEHSIVGSLLVYQNEVQEEPISITISDSVVDACSNELHALSAPGDGFAHAALTIARSTVFGQMRVHAIKLAENCIFEGAITVARRQLGCLRFCSYPAGSRTPRSYRCQPQGVEQAAAERMQRHPKQERLEVVRRERTRVRPVFNSVRYGKPTYCQLALVCASEIRQGAEDESEMGVFHDLFQPQREANLRVRLNEYTPAEMEAGIIYVS